MPLSYRSTHIDLSSKQHKCAAPKFYAMPHNRLAEEGETVRFQCAIAGHPTVRKAKKLKLYVTSISL